MPILQGQKCRQVEKVLDAECHLVANLRINIYIFLLPIAPPPEKMTENEPMAPLLTDRPQAVILDDKGRTVDAAGQQITLTQYVPSLKANLRAKKRDELKEKEPTAALEIDQTKFFDGRVAIKGKNMISQIQFTENSFYRDLALTGQ